MTPAELDEVVRWWIPRLGLGAWAIEVIVDAERWLEQAPTPDAHAFVWRSNDYDTARVYLNPHESPDWTPLDAHEHVTHELVHLLLRDLEQALSLGDGQLHRDVADVIEKAHRHALEGAVDRIAHRLVELAGPARRGA